MQSTLSRIWTTEITKTANPSDIIMTVRAPVGKFGIAHQKICIGRGVCSISSHIKVSQSFIFEKLKLINWKTFEQGSTFTAINSGDIKNITIKIPDSIEEQSIIAKYCTDLNLEIQLHQRKLSLLKDQKKYLLNKLVTGEIRTPEDLTIFSRTDEKEV